MWADVSLRSRHTSDARQLFFGVANIVVAVKLICGKYVTKSKLNSPRDHSHDTTRETLVDSSLLDG